MLLIYSALSPSPFRSIRLRKKKSDCLACGNNARTGALLDQSDYVAVCGSLPPDWESLGYQNDEGSRRVTAKVI
jgi:adenylyltransferase/sulfurtransferase